MDEPNSLILFGNDAQLELRKYSKELSHIIVNSADFDEEIQELGSKLDGNEKKSDKKFFSLMGFPKKKQEKDSVSNSYDDLEYIDKVTTYIKIQEAQLIKDNMLIEEIKNKCNKCDDRIQNSIEEGEEYLSLMKKKDNLTHQQHNYLDRLDRKIIELRKSKQISLQFQAQVDLLVESNNLLIDRMLEVLNVTIPLWTNSISSSVANEKNKNVSEISNRLNDSIKSLSELYQKKQTINEAIEGITID